MFASVAARVAQLHARKVAHCDIKLDNCLVRRPPACVDGHASAPLDVVLCDFGECRMFERADRALLHDSRSGLRGFLGLSTGASQVRA